MAGERKARARREPGVRRSSVLARVPRNLGAFSHMKRVGADVARGAGGRGGSDVESEQGGEAQHTGR